MKLIEPRIQRWTRDEYYQMAKLGWFRGKRVFLLSREIYEMPGQGNWHSVRIGLAQEVLRSVFPADRYWVRIQMPLDFADGTSEPEPDFAVAPGTLNDFVRHPETCRLVVKISDSTLKFNRKKAAHHAAAGFRNIGSSTFASEFWKCIAVPRDRSENGGRTSRLTRRTRSDRRYSLATPSFQSPRRMRASPWQTFFQPDRSAIPSEPASH